ncbi:TBC1 domain family member 31-like [Saccoglossus kowalevskii]|uniref:TBC1 domain family member 31 n=1 Tax=Saccoglossus kowalevskii TaxID=10224 RepID=A0ABM0M8W8_SACKO|nr:PREDICTED: TBC1 domain family member 31-like [Saccoglossus kowalevskii]
MQSLDVNKKDSGKIWHRKPIPSGDNGLMVEIQHDTSSAFSLQNRYVRFLHAAFDSTGDRFVAGDHQGNIYVFDLLRNRFQLVQKTGTACTALAFTLRRRTEFLVALSDCSLKCYDTDTRELVSWMKGHTTPIHTISIHASGRYALTTSNDIAQLWDLDTFERKRKLNVRQSVGILKVFFLPLSNTIMTCFKDDSIFAWESDTLQCKYQLTIPAGQKPAYKSFATPKDGRLLVAGGKSRFIHIWALDTRRLLRIIELPNKVKVVKQLEFLPESFDGGSSQVVGVLSQDGIMRFVNVNTCKLLFDIGTLDDRIHHVTVSSHGRFIVAVTESGKTNIYSAQALTAELNKPPPPLVKAMSCKDKSADLSRSRMLRSVTPKDTVTVTTKDKKKTRMIEPGMKVRTPTFEDETCELPEGLNMDRLISILKGYGEYPSKYRMFIWRSLLRLPENHAAYSSLTDKGTHIAWANVHEQYPIKSRKLLRVLQRTLSGLAHWSAIFGETDYLPLLGFPFIKLFQNNQLVCFEVIATILLNWCQHWFEFFPNPPINVLSMVENVLAYHDKELLQHFIRYNVTTQIYAWPLMETLFSEVLTKDEWLKLWDNVFSNHPSFFLITIVSYCICSRQPLLQCIDKEDFEYFFHHRNSVDIGAVIKEAYHLQDTTPDDVHPVRMLDDFKPLTKGQYPVFNKYPKFIVDYQAQERERIRQDEMEYLRQRQAAMELKKETEKRQQEETAWYRQQELIKDAEEERRKLLMEEEQKLVDQRVRLNAMKRELRIKEMQLIDAARRKFVHHEKQQRETELKRLDEELARKVMLREQETKSAMEDVDIKNMELYAQKKMLEQELARIQSEADYHRRVDYDAKRKQHELEERAQQRVMDQERETEHDLRKGVQRTVAQAEQLHSDAQMRKETEVRGRLDDIERELKSVELARHNDQNRQMEEEIQDLMRRLEEGKLETAMDEQEQYNKFKALSEVAERRRLQLLQEEATLAREHAEELRNSMDASFERLRDIRTQHVENSVTSPLLPENVRTNGITSTDNTCLNNLSSSPDSDVPFTLDRGRKTFERREQELLREVRDMRRKLASESRRAKPPPDYISDDDEE